MAKKNLKFGGKSKRKWDSTEFMEFVFSKSGLHLVLCLVVSVDLQPQGEQVLCTCVLLSSSSLMSSSVS